MTSTTDARASRNGRATTEPLVRAGAPLPVRERRPAYIALAVVLIVGLAAVGAYFYTQAGRKTPVVEVVNHIAAGHPITRSDLTTVDVAGAVTAIGGDSLESLVGQRAAVELLAHTLLQRAMVTDAPTLNEAQAQVGVQVKPGQIPADGLSAGDAVEVLQLPAQAGASSGGTTSAVSAVVIVDDATVYATAPDPSQSGGTLLTLVVPRSDVAAIATASNASLIALVRVGS
ncbi:SAF domain-containing protein [Jatrophihabitans sp. YIM 134969]